MASPQTDNGFTKIANEIMDHLCKTRIPGEAMQVLNFILRKTYGWNKIKDAIPLSQFVEGTGLKKPHVIRAIYHLSDMNLIIIEKDNDEKNIIEKDNIKKTNSYMFNKDYETWKPLSKKITTYKKEPVLKNYCYVCGFDESVEKHHIIPRSEGGSNTVKNLIMLCPNCHSVTHKGKYDREFLLSKKIIIENVTKKDNGFEQNDEKPLSKKVHSKYNTKYNKEIYDQNSLIDSVSSENSQPTPTANKPNPECSAKKKPAMSEQLSISFGLFWQEYPRKVSKKTAEAAWIKINPQNGTVEQIISALKEYKKTEQWQKNNGQFIPHPSSWLNQERWKDEITCNVSSENTDWSYWENL